ncbi:hypothetical protein HGB07_06785 [Candidatus Roizmanbacteria bacterium]|nr:hypothetical protein [Candidatus Roizmanbacteria bacterium]
MNNKVILESLVMDFKRVALGYYRHADKMSERFYEESLRRIQEVDDNKISRYIVKILRDVELLSKEQDKMRIGEYALMYSTLIENYVRSRLL